MNRIFYDCRVLVVILDNYLYLFIDMYLECIIVMNI